MNNPGWGWGREKRGQTTPLLSRSSWFTGGTAVLHRGGRRQVVTTGTEGPQGTWAEKSCADLCRLKGEWFMQGPDPHLRP